MDTASTTSPLVSRLGADVLRRAVRERYDTVATEPGGSYNFQVGRAFAEALGYPRDLLDRLPPSSVERFTGVATPVFSAGLRPGERVLDLGCGAGVDTAVAAEAVGTSGRVIAVDFAPGMVRRAAAVRDSLGLSHVAVCQASAEALPVAGASVDCVLVNGLFNLVPDRAKALSEAARVLRPDGRMVAAETVLTKPLGEEELSSVDDWFR